MRLLVFSSIALIAALAACSEPDTERAPPVSSEWAAVLKGYVSVEGGVINIAAPRPGIVREVNVAEGDEVKAGAVLARIDDREARLALAIREAEEQKAQRGILLLQVQQAAAERELNRLTQLPDNQVVPRRELDMARDQLRTLSAQLAEKEAELVTARAEVAASQFEVEQHVVRAPLAGRVIRRLSRPGDGASTLNVTPLFVFAPDGPRIVRADLDEHFVDAVKPDQAAQVVLQADESKVYKARVLRLGSVFGSRQDTDDPNEKQDVRVLECVLALEASDLRIGQRVLVKIARSSPTTAQTK